jgi:hypothetical protein
MTEHQSAREALSEALVYSTSILGDLAQAFHDEKHPRFGQSFLTCTTDRCLRIRRCLDAATPQPDSDTEKGGTE